jgi:hypothetical protein
MSQHRSTEQLVAIGLELTTQRQLIDLQLHEVRRELDGRFPGVKTQEEISTKKGRAVRMVRHEYWIAPGKLGDVRRILGTAYAHLLDPEQPLVVTPRLRALSKDERSDVGRLLRPYIKVDRRIRISFRAPLSALVVTDGVESQVVDFETLFSGDGHGH